MTKLRYNTQKKRTNEVYKAVKKYESEEWTFDEFLSEIYCIVDEAYQEGQMSK